jgi:hypothetical protein
MELKKYLYTGWNKNRIISVIPRVLNPIENQNHEFNESFSTKFSLRGLKQFRRPGIEFTKGGIQGSFKPDETLIKS